MCHARLIHAGLWGVLMTAAIASATTVQFDIVALENNQPITTTNPTITVTPGAQVDYEVTALVSSAAGATTPDNNGLGYFRFDILTDLTVTQPAVTGIEASINSAFNFLVSLGTPTGDDILTVRAAQNTLSGTTALLAGVAEGTSQVIVGGVLNTPTVEGTYHVVLGGTLEASVFAAGGTSTLNSVTPTVGPVSPSRLRRHLPTPDRRTPQVRRPRTRPRPRQRIRPPAQQRRSHRNNSRMELSR